MFPERALSVLDIGDDTVTYDLNHSTIVWFPSYRFESWLQKTKPKIPN